MNVKTIPPYMAAELSLLGVTAPNKQQHQPITPPKEKPKYEFRHPPLDENGEVSF